MSFSTVEGELAATVEVTVRFLKNYKYNYHMMKLLSALESARTYETL